MELLFKFYLLTLECAGFVTLLLFSPMLILLGRLIGILRRRKGEKPFIIHGFTPHMGMYYMVKADKLAGFHSELWADCANPNLADRSDCVDKCFDTAIRKWKLGPLPRYFALAWALLRCDIYFTTYTTHFLRSRHFEKIELPLFKMAGKKIIVRAYGSDVQQVDKLLAKGYQYHLYMDYAPKRNKGQDEAIRKNIAHVDKYADFVFSGNDWIDFTPRCDAVFRFPIDLAEWEPAFPVEKKIVKVVHATRHRHFKGSQHLERAIEELVTEGLPVEYIFVDHKTVREAREIYREADIIADQFIMGMYANFALEGMALGKPVMGYLRDEWFEINDHWKECPIVNSPPQMIKENLKKLVLDYQLRLELGRKGRAYAEKYHDIRSQAPRMAEIYMKVWNECR